MIAAFTLAQILNYPFPSAPVRDVRGTAIAYTLDTQGTRTIWFARGPRFEPQQLFSSAGDDGQELSNLAISPDDSHVVYVRGGDHDENWPQALQPNPASSAAQPQMQVWSVSTGPSTRPAASLRINSPKLLGDGDAPAISPDGTRVAFTNGGAVMIAPIDGGAPAKRMFFDRGQDSDLRWSPDGSALAFVSTRTDHSFIAIYRNDTMPIRFMAPTTSQDFNPRWSPDGKSIAFIRVGGDGGPPQNPLNWNPTPWQIWVADVDTANAHRVWASGTSARDSLPQSGLGPFLEWISGDRLVFNSERSNWPHLYGVSASGGHERLLTPGSFMVEDVSVAPDLKSIVYTANTGSTPGDDDRRHLFSSNLTTAGVAQFTHGASSETGPVVLAGGAVA
ncbi:MAG: DPP IV N-terminal domain-containing protein, partial [Candidatus Cybelea sp.]